MIVLFAMIFLGFGAGAFGLAKVQLVHGKEYAAKAEAGQLRDTEVAARRGDIYDSNMKPIAQSASAGKVYINPSSLAKASNSEELLAVMCKELAPILGISEARLRNQASYSNRNYMSLRGQVELATMEKVNAFREKECIIKTNGKDSEGKATTLESKSKYGYFIGVQPDVIRFYPLKSFAANLLGFTGADDIGRAGLELYYNKELTGTPGRIVSAKNAADANLPIQYESMYNPIPGNSLVLTIDEVIQRYLERSLEQAKIDAKAKAAYGIIMDVKTGAILGMSCVSSYDPGDYQSIADEEHRRAIEAITDEQERKKAYNQAMMEQWRNGTIELTYEPGSVFKTITVSAALEEGVIGMNTQYTCTGSTVVAGRRISCHKHSGHGLQDLTQGLMNSCNPFMIEIGQKLGVERFYKYFTAFGFTETTGIDLPNEAVPKPGINIHTQQSMHSVELASCSFGQSFEASPIQILTAVSAIANGGKLMQPYVVAKVLDENQRVLKETKPTVRRQVISADTAEKMAGMMEQVVVAGTGKNGYVAGGRVAGKTGTSEKLSAKEGYVASFCCFAPADSPEIAMLIAIDEPVGLINGGQIAAPPAAEIMENILVYKNVELRYNEKEQEKLGGSTPNAVGGAAASAAQRLEAQGFSVRVIGKGETVLHQIPESGRSIAQNGLIILYTEDGGAAQTVKVPVLTGLSITQANKEAAAAGLNIKLTGNFESNNLVTYRQSIAPGEEVPLGTAVTVHFVSNNGVVDR
jgi:stage V sporulation protein D (sporulation-specific penicillin-binding protein)